MKKNLAAISVFAAFAALCSAENIGDIVKSGDNCFMLVREFNTPEENDQFQRNLNIMRNDARYIDFLKKKIAETVDKAQKVEFSAKLKDIEDNFKLNDSRMQNTYGFASNREYKMVFLESNICTAITKAELSNLRAADGKELDPMLISQKDKLTLYRHATISGVNENRELQQIIGFTISRRAETENLRKRLSETTDPQEQLKISDNLAKLEKALKENDEKIRVKYGIKPKVDYVIEASKAKMYLLITPEEAAKIIAERKAAAAKEPAK